MHMPVSAGTQQQLLWLLQLTAAAPHIVDAARDSTAAGAAKLSATVDNLPPPLPPPPPPARSLIHLDPRQLGPRFDGLGGVSAGTGPRLLVDYPVAARDAVLDFLFLPTSGRPYKP
jgi:hypothetical protein